ncbi:OmpA family protein [Sphingomonas sp. RT2P30]|uniref:OmpA family protein n=1 Tax=Parasphingomonas halimpatiens TaxID=3096162 RepID=UPI002FCBC489
MAGTAHIARLPLIAAALLSSACSHQPPVSRPSALPPPAQQRPLPPPSLLPPTIGDCTPGPFIVFFAWDDTAITPEAAAILDNALAQYANCGRASVRIAGFADRSGPPRYNVVLSLRRAEVVRAYFAGHAVDPTLMTIRAFGEDPAHLRVKTPDGVQQVQNRRVEVTYGPEPD